VIRVALVAVLVGAAAGVGGYFLGRSSVDQEAIRTRAILLGRAYERNAERGGDGLGGGLGGGDLGGGDLGGGLP